MKALPSCLKALARALPARYYCSLQFAWHQGRWPNLRKPTTLNEKIQWLKLHYRDPLMSTCADKYRVRGFVQRTVGEQYAVPLGGSWTSADEIDFESLPKRFVLKANHGSGWNIVCPNSSELDVQDARARCRDWLDSSFAEIGCEWAYQGIEPRIVAEAFLSGSDGQPPWDYKFFCFRGTPRFIQVDYDRFAAHTRSLYTPDWQMLPCGLEYARHEEPTERPDSLAEMLQVASALSRAFPFVRVDLYECDGGVFFGEMTFYPGKGIEVFDPVEYDSMFGEHLDIDQVRQSKYFHP